MILRPRFLSLDTSTIAKLARDFFGGDSARRTNVIAVRNKLIEDGWFLTLTGDHLVELAQHSLRTVVISRFKFLKTFQNLAWIWNYEKTGIGCFLDVDCFEISAFIENESCDKKRIVEKVREKLIYVGSGDELFRYEDYDLWLKLANESKRGLVKSQVTASILRTEPVQGISRLKLREFQNCGVESLDQLPKKIASLAAVMASQIKQHGDHRVQNEDDLAKGFYRQTLRHINEIRNLQKSVAGGAEFIESVAAVFEIPPPMVDLEMTVGQLAEWGHFAMMLKMYSSKLGFPLTIEHVQPEFLPGWTLRSELRRFQNQANTVSGSDFGDCNLACLIPYLTTCEVDKRTMDYLRRITKLKTSNFTYLNHWFKLADYSRIFNSLPQ